MFRNTYATVGQDQQCVRLRIADCGLRNCRFPIRNPKSEIRNCLGITLTEVLISLGILTIGLLGVAALFPVGSYYMQQGEIADQGSAIAQAAFNDAVAQGWLNPERWLMYEDPGVVSGVTSASAVKPNSFTRPFASSLRQQITYQKTDDGWLGTPDVEMWNQTYRASEFGSVFVIDPAGVASIALVDPVTGAHAANVANGKMQWGGLYPATGYRVLPVAPNAISWSPWTNPVGPRWPMRRVTFRQPFTSDFYQPWGMALADRMFSAWDDLAQELPQQQDRPAIQRWRMAGADLNGDGNATNDPLRRQSRGDYSWIVTVAPTTADARDALATDPSAHYYEVSVAVFYKRSLPATNPRTGTTDELTPNIDLLRESERAVGASIVSTGLNGGEVRLTRYPTPASSGDVEPISSPFDVLNEGRWILLCGPHPNSTPERPNMVARWYRVLSIEDESNPGLIDDPANQRLVSLRGPQWPWQPEPYENWGDYAYLSNSLYACIPDGVVAVHSRTIHLQGRSVWGGGAPSVNGPQPPGNDNVGY